jgi:hypothetical protein
MNHFNKRMKKSEVIVFHEYDDLFFKTFVRMSAVKVVIIAI